MREFPSQAFMMVIGQIEHNLGRYRDKELGWSEHLQGELLKHFTTLAELCSKYGLLTTASTAKLTVDKYATPQPDPGFTQLSEEVRIARRVLNQEMGTLCYMEIPPAQRHYWNNQKPFGASVSARFPETDYDLEQAAKCLALDRYTACVFHLMRALDHVLNIFAGHIGATFDPMKNWKPILKAIKDKIDPMPEGTIDEKQKKEDYQRVYGHLQAVMNAWRNPTMHPRKDYDIESAEDVFCTTRGFMRDLTKVI